MKWLAVGLAMMASVVVMTAQQRSLSNVKDTRIHADRVVDLFSKGQYTTAFEELRMIWHFPMDEIDALESKTKESMASVVGRYGSPTGYEFLRETKAATSVVRYRYVVRCGFHPLHVRVTYYRGSKGWILNSFVWDDEVGPLLGE